MKILLTFTGFHDPFARSTATGEMRAGPILTVVAEHPFPSLGQSILYILGIIFFLLLLVV